MHDFVERITAYIHWAIFLLLEVLSGLLLFKYNSYQGSIWFTQANTAAAYVHEWEAKAFAYLRMPAENAELVQRNILLQHETDSLRHLLAEALKDSSATEKKQNTLFKFIKSRIDGDVLAFATDTVNLRYKFPGLNILAIEANYDKNILERCEKMPEKVRYRIANAHMEIDTLCDYLRDLDLSQCREIHLLHLSDATSHEGHFINKVARAVPRGIEITACKK